MAASSIGLELRARGLPRPPVVAALSCGALAIVLTAVVAYVGGGPLSGDVSLIEAVQRGDFSGSDGLAATVNVIGSPWHWVAIAAGLVYLGWRLRSGEAPPAIAGAFAALLAIALLLPLNSALKELVESPRPDASAGIVVDQARESYGFPSGHVFSVVLLVGFLLAYARGALPRGWVSGFSVVCIATVLLAGWARVYVGAHWPSDVLGGYLWGGAALGAVLGVGLLAQEYMRRRTGGIGA